MKQDKDSAERLTRELTEFNRERDEAFLSMDEQRIRAMFRKWNETEMPSHPVLFWGAVHKAVTGSINLPIEFRRKSKAWLTEHGLRSLDDGDL